MTDMRLSDPNSTVQLMSRSFGGRRWTCPTCQMRNKAWRVECFRDNCSITREDAAIIATMQNQKEGEGERKEVLFKDEMSRVIARMPASVANKVRADLGMMTKGLNIYFTNETTMPSTLFDQSEKQHQKEDAARRTNLLQRKMRHGLQQRRDFDDSVALMGYTRRKFGIRAVVSMQLFRSFFFFPAEKTAIHTTRRKIESAFLESPSQLISIGGGPGNDLFGAILFERHFFYSRARRESSNCDHKNNARCFIKTAHHFDLSPCWAPIVDQVVRLSRGCSSSIFPVTTNTCDLHKPLVSPTNQALANLMADGRDAVIMRPAPLVFLFCYVINEVMKKPSGDTPLLLHDLIMSARQQSRSTVFLFREPNTNSLQTIASRYSSSGGNAFEFVELDEYGSYALLVLPQEHGIQ